MVLDFGLYLLAGSTLLCNTALPVDQPPCLLFIVALNVLFLIYSGSIAEWFILPAIANCSGRHLA